jgi:hypothetical protein
MLDKTNNRSKSKRQTKRKAKRHREEQRRHAARVRAGRRCAIVEYDAWTIDMLIRLSWLSRDAADNAVAIGPAIEHRDHRDAGRGRKERVTLRPAVGRNPTNC